MNNIITTINQSGFNFYFLVVDKYLDIKVPEIKSFKSITTSKFRNSGQLLSSTSTRSYIQQDSENKKVAIVPFKPSAKIDHLCRQYGWTSVSNPAQINRQIEDKIKFYQLCYKNKLPVVKSIITTLSQESFKPNFVIQTHFGWAGKNTYQFANYQDAISKVPPGTTIKISPYLHGYTLTNNCCLTKYGLLQSQVALQYTGISPYTDNNFATVGRQWPSFAPQKVLDRINTITNDFSNKILQPIGYRGFFGLDFLINDDQVYLLECNPRLTASFAFYTRLELNMGITPLFFYHLLEFIGASYNYDTKEATVRLTANIIGSELTPKDKQGRIIDKIHHRYPLITNPNEKTFN